LAVTTRVNPGNHFVEFSREESEQSVTERFEKQVRKNPGHIAVQTSHVQLTYDDLNRSANRLARVLLQQCRDDRPVAILMEQDASALVAIFGALKAAKIFILLDPALPDARIGQILDDSGSNSIVTNDQNLGIAKDLLKGDQHLINLNSCDTVPDASNLNLRILPDSVSHILYTSGSTGKPKGVVRTHRNDLHNIRNRTNSFCISGDDRITLLGSFSTGQGMTDIYSALLNGATLFPRNLKREGLLGLAEWLMQERMTIYHSSATFFRHFVGESSNDVIFPELRIVNVGGEPVTWKDVELYKSHFSDDCILINELSCSEASTFAQFFVNKKTEINLTVPVGYPVEGKDVLILDERGNPLRSGEGEIAICSRFLSPGYWNQPDLTKLAFSPDRESQERRIYRTGDLGRKSADGCLEYLGRKDTGVKIRGYRVECYEIELVLLQNPAVDQAFVTQRQDSRDETYLVAYVVCNKGARVTLKELRADLVARLPEYMVPTAFVFIDTLPLTPAGKIDHRALPEPSTVRPPLDVTHAAPRDPVEESVAKLCAQILGISVIGVHDNLFDLGGNSLLAMQIVARVMKMFRVSVPLKLFYESPTIASLSAIIATSHGPTEDSEELGISQAPRDCPLTLSYFQERLWFMEQWDPGKATYNFCQAYRLAGHLDARAMEEGLNTVIERHDVLRTSFIADDDRPLQVIAPVLRLRLATLDLRTLPEAERNATSFHLAQEDARRPFDLAQGPLLRALLVKLADEEHLLVLTVHQIVCDGWSMRILLSEFWTAYEAICRGGSPSLPALSFQYADFAVWQRQLLSEEWTESLLSFWKKTLGATLPVLSLPTDYPRPALQSFRGSRIFFGLPDSLTAALYELSRQEGVTLFMTLMAAFKTLLYRYTGQEDLIVGFPVADRFWSEATGSIGFFVNTLVARTELSGEPTFREFLFRVRDMCLSAYSHQDLPFEKLVEVLRPLRDLSRNPLFQAMFTFQNMPLAYPVPPELSSTPISVDNGTSKFDLTLSLAERDSQLNGFFEYCTDLFDRTTIERMADHFQTLLECIVAERNEPLATLPFLSERERHQLLVEWNNTKAEYPNASCIHELFETQVARTPDAIAVEDEEKTLTYLELNGRANKLAHYLRELGAGPGSLVGICLERSAEMVVGLLGILKAGGAYVPLDPSCPAERLAFMLDDAEIAVLLTQESLLENGRLKLIVREGEGIDKSNPQSLIVDTGMKVVCLDRDESAIAGESQDNPGVNTRGDGFAYVIYTSGSTGTPKGVSGLHRGAVNRFAWMWKVYPFQSNEKSCVKTSLSFVDSVWEVFGPLLQGVPLVLIPDDVLRDPQRLFSTLRDHHVTRIGLVPSLLKTLLDTFPVLQDHLPELKLWCCSGEILPKEVVERFRKSMPDATLLNLYGSTEVSADVTCCDAGTANSNRVIPIGRPLSNTQIYILDSNLQPVPIGVSGELHVGGDGVAPGYLNRAELTAAKFVANPFSVEPGSRLYRTGDRARYLPDGNIEFLGRIDNQIKIRGYRIELGEIEAALNQHPAVNQSVVVAQDGTMNDWSDAESCKSKIENQESERLVAYIVPTEQKPSITELRSFLGEKLPEYMMPSAFVILELLPLTSNGKVDRQALPRPDDSRPNLEQIFVEPRTEIEEFIAQAWREVLKLEKIGVHDNFFELGGHSLLATQVVSRLRKNLDIDLPLRKLFELPTIAALASFIDTLLQDQKGAKVPPIFPVSRNQIIPLSFSQQRLWFLHELDPTMTAYNISAAFRVEGPLNVIVLEKALNEIVARHEILRTTFPILEGSPVQNILPNLKLRVDIVDLGNLPEEARQSRPQEVSLEESRQVFDLRSGPLLRAKILRFSDQFHFLLLNVDHSVLDGWSINILFKELATLYEAFAENDVCPLAPLSIQYADYAVWQREFFQGEVLESQLAYWRQQLGDKLPALNLPTDFPRPWMQTFKGARKSFLLSKQLTEALKTLSRREGVTPFMTLLAAFQILLCRYTGQEDIVVGSTVAGRNRSEIEGLIGFFINALVLRVDLSGNPTFAELLERVREVCLGAYTHQDLPFEKIVETIASDRDLSRNPLFQVMFNMVDISQHVLQLSGCDVKRESFVDPEAKFDITLHAPEKNGAIELAIVYNTDLFSESRIAAVLEQFHYLLCQIAQRPEKQITAYSLVSLSTRALLPDPTEPLDDTWHGAIHTLFSKQAEHQPDRVAVVDPDETWAYRELDKRSNQLANYLIAGGIQPKDVVGIYAHRSSTLMLALLGILKSGAAFVVLDPAYPSARSIDYLRITRPRGWVQMHAAGELPAELSGCLDSLEIRCRISVPSAKEKVADLLSGYSESDVGIPIDADDFAYIAFTSGSTGQPKGVLCRHGPMTHFLPWQAEEFDLKSTDRFSLLSGLAYNHLHRDVFTALVLGATICVPAPQLLKSPDLLMEWLDRNEISVLHLTPALGRLLRTSNGKTLPSVHRIFFGGDVLTREDVTLTRELAPNAKIVSFYGATETQRGVGYYEVPEETSTSNKATTHPISLGRGIKDVQLLLLNKNGQLAGIGELAELYMRSPHLAAGYIGDEKLTRESFVINPFTNNLNDRLYRTGELGRYLPDGNVEWAGRNDRRVNIRGFRVELAEVESVLSQHLAVKDAAVVAKEFLVEGASPISTHDLRLVAYVVPELDQPLSIDGLRSFLTAKLPDYMVPSHFLIMGRLPLTLNGKVDYEALPLAGQSQTGATEWFVAPRNDLEASLCKIFSQVLGLEQVGVNDNFFRLGGHSLLAAQAATRIKQAFGVVLELRTFLESPTVAVLAQQIGSLRSAGQTTEQSAKDEREEIEI
jgi:amino acid adenylation domain-containing protein